MIAGSPFIVIALLMLWVVFLVIPPSRWAVTLASIVLSALLLGMAFPALVGERWDPATVLAAVVGGAAFAQPLWLWAYRKAPSSGPVAPT